jgi:hypothetical protein
MRRTAVINQIRGLRRERGITLRQGRCPGGAAVPGILEDARAQLSGAVRRASGFLLTAFSNATPHTFFQP